MEKGRVGGGNGDEEKGRVGGGNGDEEKMSFLGLFAGCKVRNSGLLRHWPACSEQLSVGWDASEVEVPWPSVVETRPYYHLSVCFACPAARNMFKCRAYEEQWAEEVL